MKSTAKRLLTSLMAAAMVCSCAACGSSGTAGSEGGSAAASSGAAEKTDVRIGLITPLGGLGDNSIGDETYNGVKKASELLGFAFDYSEPMTAPDMETLIDEYSSSGDYDLIFMAGNDGVDSLLEICPNYPDQKYLVYDLNEESSTQISSQYFAKNQMGFMAGAFAALLEQKGELEINGVQKTWEPSHTIGLIIGGEYPSTIPALTGAAAGFKYINAENDYLYGIVGDWSDQTKNKELALSMYDSGAHFVFHNCGVGCYGILEAAKERDQFMIGYDANQNVMDADHIVASSTKSNQDVIVRVLTEYVENGTLPWGTATENGYENNGIGFVYQENTVIPEDIQATMEEIKAKLASGEIVAPNTWEEVDAFDLLYNS